MRTIIALALMTAVGLLAGPVASAQNSPPAAIQPAADSQAKTPLFLSLIHIWRLTPSFHAPVIERACCSLHVGGSTITSRSFRVSVSCARTSPKRFASMRPRWFARLSRRSIRRSWPGGRARLHSRESPGQPCRAGCGPRPPSIPPDRSIKCWSALSS